MDLVRASSSLFPEVLRAVEQLREVNSNRETRTFARRVASEKIVYDQFARRLALLSPLPSASQGLMVDVEYKIGPSAALELQRDLGHMNESLRLLKADIFNASRGTEVLAKLGRKTSPLKGPAASSPLQKSLIEVARTNKRLSAYLLQPLVSLPIERELKAPLELRILAEGLADPVCRFLQITGGQFSCLSCTDTILGTSTPSTEEIRYKQYEGSTPFRQQYFGNLNLSVDRPVIRPDSTANLLAQPVASPRASQAYFVSKANIDNDHTGPRIFITTSSREVQPGFVELDALVDKIGRTLDLSERVDLSFHVALVTLMVLFEATPFQSIDKDQFDILADPTQVKGPFTLVLQSLPRSPVGAPSHSSMSQEMLSVMTEDLALARLGVQLVQIMFGKTMETIRLEVPDVFTTLPDMDSETQDIVTARQLLTSRRVRNKLGRDFEAIINVCLNQQYRERKLARVVKLDRRNLAFPKCVTSLILLPLFQELRKAVGCFCDLFSDDDHFLHETLHRQGPKSVESLDDEAVDSVERLSWQLLETNPAESAEVAQDRTPTMSNVGIPNSLSGGSAVKAAKIPLPSHNRGFSQEQMPSATETQDSLPARTRHRTSSGAYRISPQSPEPRATIMAITSPSLHLSPGLTPSRGHDMNVRLGPGSVQSYEDDMSDTTESWLDWLSDRTEEPPVLPPDHPLSFLTASAIAILMNCYNKWQACAIEQNPGSAAPNGSSPVTNRRKRPRVTNDAQDDGEENGEDDADRPSDPTSRKKQPLNESGVTFSCPYLKKDSVKHGECSKYMLSRIRDVKQHLGRRHQMPIYCPRCIKTFHDEDSRDEHNRNEDCERSTLGKPEGITKAQKEALGKKAQANQSQEQQWYGIFDILFPGHPRPESPYIDSALLRNAFIYQSFLHSNGPRILSSVLENSGAVTWNPPPYTQADEQVWREQVLAQAFQELFDRWANTGAVTYSNPSYDANNGAVPAETSGPSSTHMMLSPQQTIETASSSTMGDDLYRFDMSLSDAASSEMFSWQSESDVNNNDANMGIMSSPFGGLPNAPLIGNFEITPFGTQTLHRDFQRGMDFNNHSNDGNPNNNDGHGYRRSDVPRGQQHNTFYRQ